MYCSCVHFKFNELSDCLYVQLLPTLSLCYLTATPWSSCPHGFCQDHQLKVESLVESALDNSHLETHNDDFSTEMPKHVTRPRSIRNILKRFSVAFAESLVTKSNKAFEPPIDKRELVKHQSFTAFSSEISNHFCPPCHLRQLFIYVPITYTSSACVWCAFWQL